MLLHIKKLASLLLIPPLLMQPVNPNHTQEQKQVTIQNIKTEKSVTDITEYENPEIIVLSETEFQNTEEYKAEKIMDDAYLLSTTSFESLEQIMDDLKENPSVSYFQPNYEYSLDSVSANPVLSGNNLEYSWFLNNTGTDETVSELYYKKGIDINWETVKDKIQSKKEVVIALIDTGVKYDHAMIKDVMWKNEDEIPGNGIDDDNNGYVDDVDGWNFYNNNNKVCNTSSSTIVYENHGTHCAGIMSTLIEDSNAKIKIMPLKIIGANGGSTAALAKAIDYAEKNGADICSMSIGTKDNDIFMLSAVNKTSLQLVCAAGNGDKNHIAINIDCDETPVFPASYSHEAIVSVTNITMSGELNQSANYGKTSVDIAAPGTKICSSSADSNKYLYMTGTSMATPMVTATLAIAKSMYPEFTNEELKEILIESAKQTDELKDKCVSNGMLDVNNFLEKLEEKSRQKQILDPTLTPVITGTPGIETPTPSAIEQTPTAVPVNIVLPTSTPEIKTEKPQITPIIPTRTPYVSPTVTPARTPYVTPTVKSTPTKTPPTQTPAKTQSPVKTQAPKTPVPVKTKPPVSLIGNQIYLSNTPAIGKKTVIRSNTQNVNGISYLIEVYKDNSLIKKSDASTLSWTPTKPGIYKIKAVMKLGNTSSICEKNITVAKTKVSLKGISKKMKKNKTIKMTVQTDNKLKFMYDVKVTKGNKKYYQKVSKVNGFSFKLKKSGTYKIYCQVTDQYGNKSSITKTVKIGF